MKIKVIGIGGCGCNTLLGFNSKDISDISLVMVDEKKKLLKLGRDFNGLSIEKNDCSVNDKLHELLLDTPNVLVVVGLGGVYGSEIAEALCRVHKSIHGAMGFVWIFAIMPFHFEGCVKRASYNFARIDQLATKMIAFDNNSLIEDGFRPLTSMVTCVGQKLREIIEEAHSLSIYSKFQDVL